MTSIASSTGNDALKSAKEFIHFGLTSQDINNTANPMMINRFILAVYIPKVIQVLLSFPGLGIRAETSQTSFEIGSSKIFLSLRGDETDEGRGR